MTIITGGRNAGKTLALEAAIKDHFGPELNDGKHIFVFGSNRAGIHGAGAAMQALRYWGAQPYEGEGHYGESYAIPTKDERLRTLPLDAIQKHVDQFLHFARLVPDMTFLVTKIGCGLAGYTEEDIKPMFKDAPENCVLPTGWRDQ